MSELWLDTYLYCIEYEDERYLIRIDVFSDSIICDVIRTDMEIKIHYRLDTVNNKDSLEIIIVKPGLRIITDNDYSIIWFLYRLETILKSSTIVKAIHLMGD